MKSPAVATLLSALALGAVTVLWFKVDDLSDQMQVRVSQSGRQLASGVGDRAGGPSIETVAGGAEPVVPRAPAPSPASAARSEEERSATAVPSASGRGTSGGTAQAGDPVPFRMLHHRMVGSVKDLARRLDLTVAQEDRVAQAIERGRLRVEEVLKIPDESGRSPYERREEQARKIREAIENSRKNADGGARAAGGMLSLATEFFDYRNQPIPGRNATYGQEIDRIQRETRAEIAPTLSAQQKETFEQTPIEPLLGGGGSRTVSVFVADGGAADGAVVIEAGLEATAAAAGEAPPQEKGEPPAGDGR